MGNTSSIASETLQERLGAIAKIHSGKFRVTPVATKPLVGQKPGTSGLRKKTKEFMNTKNYLENFVTSTLIAVMEDDIKTDYTNTGKALLIGGDGRFYNKQAIHTIIKIAVAMGITRIWIGKDGLLSTPAVSAIIRERGPQWQSAFGAFILTASHNPGGIDEDFGIKYNTGNGGPAPEKLTNAIYENTQKIANYLICPDIPAIDISKIGATTYSVGSTTDRTVTIEVIDSTQLHVNLLRTVFDFVAIKNDLLSRPDFSMVYDSMHGVNGPYAKAIFVDELELDKSVCMNGVPKEDFGGGHADPNLTYAKELVACMGLDQKGNVIETKGDVPSFGAAGDGDGDRNMILGSKFFVTPSDSLAIIAAHANVIPFFSEQGGLKGVARSMPTSGAVDLVAKRKGFDLFETPTGWKYFGNLMDSKEVFGGKDYTPFICGEESFGTGSNHIREKDGMWAVLAWLSILAHYNADKKKALVTVKDIVIAHWKEYGRNYYSRYDFEGMDKAKAQEMMENMRTGLDSMKGKAVGGGKYKIKEADDFMYKDPVDGSEAKKQGIRYMMEDGSRVIFRLSGTAGSGATVRMYMEQYQADKTKLEMKVADALEDLVKVALELCEIKKFCGTETPTVIT